MASFGKVCPIRSGRWREQYCAPGGSAATLYSSPSMERIYVSRLYRLEKYHGKNKSVCVCVYGRRRHSWGRGSEVETVCVLLNHNFAAQLCFPPPSPRIEAVCARFLCEADQHSLCWPDDTHTAILVDSDSLCFGVLRSHLNKMVHDNGTLWGKSNFWPSSLYPPPPSPHIARRASHRTGYKYALPSISLSRRNFLASYIYAYRHNL